PRHDQGRDMRRVRLLRKDLQPAEGRVARSLRRRRREPRPRPSDEGDEIPSRRIQPVPAGLLGGAAMRRSLRAGGELSLMLGKGLLFVPPPLAPPHKGEGDVGAPEVRGRRRRLWSLRLPLDPALTIGSDRQRQPAPFADNSAPPPLT